jgi:hypothetical protein
MDNNSNDFWGSMPSVVKSIIEAGWVSAVAGAAGMSARILLGENPNMTWMKALTHTIAAAITAVFVGQAINDYVSQEGVKLAIVGISGYASPEVLDYCLRFVKKIGKSKLNS